MVGGRAGCAARLSDYMYSQMGLVSPTVLLLTACCWGLLISCAFASDADILLSLVPNPFPDRNSAESPCGWGKLNVTCDADGRVTDLDLTERGLTQLPGTFGELTELQRLVLTGNQLATLPPQFGQLRKLRTLHVERNHFTTPASIEALGGLSQLRELRLSHNDNLTTLPASICQLGQLWYLHLEWCGLTSLPECIGEMSSLRELHLSHNLMTTLPPSICQLSHLQKLHLYLCKLRSLPESFGQLGSLWQLFLEGNSITALPDSFSNIPNLTDFRYDGCIDAHEEVTCTSPLTKMCPTLQSVVPQPKGSAFRCDCDDGYYDVSNCPGAHHAFPALMPLHVDHVMYVID